METAEVIGIGTEKKLTDLKMMYENKLNTKTKIVKCFGKENFEKDWNMMREKCRKLMAECEHNGYMF